MSEWEMREVRKENENKVPAARERDDKGEAKAGGAIGGERRERETTLLPTPSRLAPRTRLRVDLDGNGDGYAKGTLAGGNGQR